MDVKITGGWSCGEKEKGSKGRGFLCGRKYRGIAINQINSQLVVMGLFVGYRQQKHVNGGIIIPLGIFSELSSPFFSLVVAISQRPLNFYLKLVFFIQMGAPYFVILTADCSNQHAGPRYKRDDSPSSSSSVEKSFRISTPI